MTNTPWILFLNMWFKEESGGGCLSIFKKESGGGMFIYICTLLKFLTSSNWRLSVLTLDF